MALAIVLILLVLGSLLFHFLSPWYFTPIASNWGTIDDTVTITLWVTGFVFVAVNLFTAYSVIRYRHRKGHQAHYEPENKKLEGWLTGITTVGIVAMLAPGLFVWAQIIDVPDDAMEFEVVGQQWQWGFRFPGEDGVLGAVEARHINAKNPFGLNPDDPHGQDDILIENPVVHLPLDQPVKMMLRSKDVLHDFAVPQFRIKMDLIPGQVTYAWLTPTREGSFEILCQELCGIAHHAMRGRVVVEPAEKFNQWLQQQPTFAQSQQLAAADPTVGKALYTVCASCHGAQGEGNPALNAPRLTGLNAAYIERQLRYFKQGVRGAHKDDIYGQQMAPMAGTLADTAAVRNVAAYIESLPVQAVEDTVQGNTDKGRKLYTTCAVCHGSNGQGNPALGAPRIAGLDGWYLVTQLKNFKAGIRGSHQDDIYGVQMISMASMLVEEQDIENVVAYISSLDKHSKIAAGD